MQISKIPTGSRRGLFEGRPRASIDPTCRICIFGIPSIPAISDHVSLFVSVGIKRREERRERESWAAGCHLSNLSAPEAGFKIQHFVRRRNGQK